MISYNEHPIKQINNQTSSRKPVKKIQRNILFLGDYKTGKSTILKSYCDDNSSKLPNNFDRYIETIGLDYYKKKIIFDGLLINLNLWDTSGNEYKAKIIPKTLSKIFHAVVICISYDNKKSLENLEQWVIYAKSICPNIHSFPRFIPIVIAFNKYDKVEKEINQKDLEIKLISFLNQENIYICSRISAKEDYGIKFIFDKILELILPGYHSKGFDDSMDFQDYDKKNLISSQIGKSTRIESDKNNDSIIIDYYKDSVSSIRRNSILFSEEGKRNISPNTYSRISKSNNNRQYNSSEKDQLSTRKNTVDYLNSEISDETYNRLSSKASMDQKILKNSNLRKNQKEKSSKGQENRKKNLKENYGNIKNEKKIKYKTNFKKFSHQENSSELFDGENSEMQRNKNRIKKNSKSFSLISNKNFESFRDKNSNSFSKCC